eukprot:CAMPEP_0197845736 /NCGR_PEP_ID=MMETSP1438-20131217/2627_1 /TAXON_ID=1461541 /ORGANISM="Pterosperma sp., Strain CCMP1384" /LENGTH=151 /DNA_ID=CAMNT_0043457143 /DNA_START=26 /DNA_END=478 /DNA_ORIENTATION=-
MKQQQQQQQQTHWASLRCLLILAIIACYPRASVAYTDKAISSRHHEHIQHLQEHMQRNVGAAANLLQSSHKSISHFVTSAFNSKAARQQQPGSPVAAPGGAVGAAAAVGGGGVVGVGAPGTVGGVAAAAPYGAVGGVAGVEGGGGGASVSA